MTLSSAAPSMVVQEKGSAHSVRSDIDTLIRHDNILIAVLLLKFLPVNMVFTCQSGAEYADGSGESPSKDAI